MAVRYIFTPPTVKRRLHPPPHDDFLRRLYVDRSLTVLKEDGFYRQVEDPTDEEVAAADIAYPGGRRYVVDESERDALVEAGYGSRITEEDDGI